MTAIPTSAPPKSRQLDRLAMAAFGAAALLAAFIALGGNGRIMGTELSPWIAVAAAGVALVAGIVAAARRWTWLAAIAAAILVLAVLPGGELAPTLLDYGLGFLFGAATLVALELVHMSGRYERANRAVERDNVPAEHVRRVTLEALKTLGGRATATLVVALGFVGVAYALAAVGPAAWRAALETTAPIDVALVALILLALAWLVILFRGAAFRRRETPNAQTESALDVAE